jgi:hypothetical protein
MAEASNAFDERLIESATGALEIFSIYLGRRLGLYQTIADAGSVTESELAEKAGIADRYAREWLEQQAVAGFLTVTQPSTEPATRKYGFTDEQESFLVRPEGPPSCFLSSVGSRRRRAEAAESCRRL